MKTNEYKELFKSLERKIVLINKFASIKLMPLRFTKLLLKNSKKSFFDFCNANLRNEIVTICYKLNWTIFLISYKWFLNCNKIR